MAAFPFVSMHDLADPIDAALGTLGLAVPNAPAQSLDLLDDHDLGLHLAGIDAGRSPETLRHHTLRIGEQLGAATADQPTTAAAAAAITVSVDSTFIRSREEG